MTARKCHRRFLSETIFICHRALAPSDSAETSDETEAKKDDQDQKRIERFKAAKTAEGTGLPSAKVRESQAKSAGVGGTRAAGNVAAAEVGKGRLPGRSFRVNSDSGRRAFEAGLQRTDQQHPHGAAVDLKERFEEGEPLFAPGGEFDTCRGGRGYETGPGEAPGGIRAGPGERPRRARAVAGTLAERAKQLRRETGERGFVIQDHIQAAIDSAFFCHSLFLSFVVAEDSEQPRVEHG